MGYTSKAIAGFTGQTLLKIISNGIVLAKIAVLARLLAPTDFGVFSLVMIALGLTEAFTQTGVNTTLVQSKKSVSYFVDTAWVIAIVRGFLIGVIMVGMGWMMAEYYEQPLLWPLITTAALVPVIKGFINPAIIGMYKELNFVADTTYRFALVVFESLAIVALVLLFKSVHAWVWGSVVAAFFEVIISFAFFTIRPHFNYRRDRAAIIFSQTKVLSLNSFFSYLIENVDNLIIGKAVGEYGLGLYQPSYSLSHETNYEVAKSVHHGTLPVYTKIADDKRRLRRAFLKTASITLGLCTLTSLPLLLFPAFFVQLIMGDQWAGTYEIVRYLSIAGWLQAIFMICYTLCIARQKVHIMNWHMGINFVLMAGLVFWGGQQAGLLGAVIGLMVSRLLVLPLIGLAVVREIN